MDGTPTFQLGGHTNDPRRLLHKCFKTFPCIFALWWGMGRESIFGKIYGGEINLCVHNFWVFIELSQWETFPSQSSLGILIWFLVILTFDAISLTQILYFSKDSCLHLPYCTCLFLVKIQEFGPYLLLVYSQ